MMAVRDDLPPAEFRDFLKTERLAGDTEVMQWERLSGGVSSEIWRCSTESTSYCLKSPLAHLRVASDWRADKARATYEKKWLTYVGDLLPDNVPRVYAFDPCSNILVLEDLAKVHGVAWKEQIFAGQVSAVFAGEVGRILAHIHVVSAGSETLLQQFDNLELFESLRLKPYFLSLIDKHPDLRVVLEGIVEEQRTISQVLIHGDYSPKNILSSNRGAVVLDAECATAGDPAFDVAFASTHLLLKIVAVTKVRTELGEALEAFWDSYEAQAACKLHGAFGRRLNRLIAAMLLARVDGKSPVEYLDHKQSKFVRDKARQWLVGECADSPRALLHGWCEAIRNG